MAIDMFATRTMLRALEIMRMPKSFLLDTFFGTVETSETEHVDIDVIKKKRRLAPFVSPMHQGHIIDRTGFTTRSFKPPYIKPKMQYSGADILKRQAGDTIYQGNASPSQRAQQQLGKDLMELIEMVTRREEWMASQALTTGKVRCTGEGIDAEIDFLMSNSHKITLSSNNRWNVDHADSKPVTNLRTWKRLISQDSGHVPDVAIFGQDVVDALLLSYANKTEDFLKLLDNRRVALGQIDPRLLPSGASFWGTIEGLDIYTYDEWYYDAGTDTEKPMVPVDHVLMGSTRARTARHYGAIQDLQATGAVPFFPKSWEEMDPSVRWVMVQSAPIVVPHEIDAFLFAKVF